jgi:hypothetical protein
MQKTIVCKQQQQKNPQTRKNPQKNPQKPHKISHCTKTSSLLNHSSPRTIPTRPFFSKLTSLFPSSNLKSQNTPPTPTPTTRPDLFIHSRPRPHAALDLVSLLTPIIPPLHEAYDPKTLNKLNLDVGVVVFHDVCSSRTPHLLTPTEIIQSTLRFVGHYTRKEHILHPTLELPEISKYNDIDMALLSHVFNISPHFLQTTPVLKNIKILPPALLIHNLDKKSKNAYNPNHEANSNGFSDGNHVEVDNAGKKYLNGEKLVNDWEDIYKVLDVLLKGVQLARSDHDEEIENIVKQAKDSSLMDDLEADLIGNTPDELQEQFAQLVASGGEEENEENENEENEEEEKIMESILDKNVQSTPNDEKLTISMSILRELGWTIVHNNYYTAEPARIRKLAELRPLLTPADCASIDSILLSHDSLSPLQLRTFIDSIELLKQVHFGNGLIQLDPKNHSNANFLFEANNDQNEDVMGAKMMSFQFNLYQLFSAALEQFQNPDQVTLSVPILSAKTFHNVAKESGYDKSYINKVLGEKAGNDIETKEEGRNAQTIESIVITLHEDEMDQFQDLILDRTNQNAKKSPKEQDKLKAMYDFSTFWTQSQSLPPDQQQSQPVRNEFILKLANLF